MHGKTQSVIKINRDQTRSGKEHERNPKSFRGNNIVPVEVMLGKYPKTDSREHIAQAKYPACLWKCGEVANWILPAEIQGLLEVVEQEPTTLCR